MWIPLTSVLSAYIIINFSLLTRTEDVVSGEENRDPKKFKNAHKEGTQTTTTQDSNTGFDIPEEPSNGNLKLNETNIGSNENTISSGVTQTRSLDRSQFNVSSIYYSMIRMSSCVN
jgi:hypothetical protein